MIQAASRMGPCVSWVEGLKHVRKHVLEIETIDDSDPPKFALTS